jgi:hypothetical protein
MVKLSYGCDYITFAHHLSLFACPNANSCIGADAVSNSVTSAEQSGNLVHIRSGPTQIFVMSLLLRRTLNLEGSSLGCVLSPLSTKANNHYGSYYP